MKAEIGYEDIFKQAPYIDAEITNKCSFDIALVHMLYVPPQMRKKGIGKRVLNEYIKSLPKQVKVIRLQSATLGSGDTMSYWTSLGFKRVYDTTQMSDKGDAPRILEMGVNGYKLPPPIVLQDGDDVHWIFDA